MRKELAEHLEKALEKGELIITNDQGKDSREYEQEDMTTEKIEIDTEKHVVVIQEKETGENELFLDLLNKTLMDREGFANKIQANEYPSYTVASINDKLIPRSKPDGTTENNLG